VLESYRELRISCDNSGLSDVAQLRYPSEQDALRLTQALVARRNALRSVLTASHSPASPLLDVSAGPSMVRDKVFAGLRSVKFSPVKSRDLEPGPEPREPIFSDYPPALTEKPHLLASLFPVVRRRFEERTEIELRLAARRFEEANVEFDCAHISWLERAEAAHQEEERAQRATMEWNAFAEQWHELVNSGHNEAIEEYSRALLTIAFYADTIETAVRAAYSAESKGLVVELVLPATSIVPAAREISLVKSKQHLKELPQKASDIAETYRTLVAGLSLRSVRDLFRGLEPDSVSVITLNGILETVDGATGAAIRPCVISVRVTREELQRLDLTQVEPVACLGHLGASVSKRPEERAPVRPIIEFAMSDCRFVESVNVIDSIDTRPNIMDLSPFEFEQLVTNLFEKMGLDAKQTRSSRDGGVDCVAFDPRPVLGGKIVIQAKRYRHTVGVSAVRDLFGTMMNEGANKGILVTTSGYGPDAFTFSRDKPIELIDGGNLLFLLRAQGIEARIVMPTSEQ
jgi:restriction system protein